MTNQFTLFFSFIKKFDLTGHLKNYLVLNPLNKTQNSFTFFFEYEGLNLKIKQILKKMNKNLLIVLLKKLTFYLRRPSN